MSSIFGSYKLPWEKDKEKFDWSSVGNAFGGEQAAALENADFLAADAEGLAEAGIGTDQMAGILEGSGFDAFEAADAAQLAGQGIGADQMKDVLGQSATAGMGSGFDVAGMAGALAKGLGALGGDSGGPKAPAAPKGSIIGQPMRTGSAAPVAQPQQTIGQAAPVSNAMQTIQNQNLGSVPTIQDVLKMRQLGLR
jgi:hypothetical protein